MPYHLKEIFIFCISLLLFNWPLLSIAGMRNPAVLMIYLFSVWLLTIFLILLAGFFQKDRNDRPEADNPPDDSADRPGNSMDEQNARGEAADHV